MYRRFAVILGGILVSASPLAGQTLPPSNPPQISTTGVGEALAMPDRATIYIAVQTRAATAVPPQPTMLGASKRSWTRSARSGSREIRFDCELQRHSGDGLYMPSAAPRTVTYSVSNSLLVKLRRIDDVGRVIDAALGKGANEISSLQFSSSTADSVRSVALAAAVVDAKIPGGSHGPRGWRILGAAP